MITLPGCNPEPLMSYLKALGVLRLLAEQKERDIRGAWKDGAFVLRTRLTQEEICNFFLNEYKPSPIVVPWSGGDFFGVNQQEEIGPARKIPTSSKIIEYFLATDSERLQPYREVIKLSLEIIKSMGVASKDEFDEKHKIQFFSELRSVCPSELIQWMDVAVVFDDTDKKYNTLLGSGGGNDGNTHFSDNLMQNLWDILPDFTPQKQTLLIRPIEELLSYIQHSLFETSNVILVNRTASLFSGGNVGGPNMSQGFERESLVNPWDIVLCLEGILCFAGSLVKRNSPSGAKRSSFPFLVDVTPVGSGSLVIKEASGYEVWLPLWDSPISYSECLYLFNEGRASFGGENVRDGLGFAKAIATLGIDRGIDEYIRYGIFKGRIGGNNYNTSSPLCHFKVHEPEQGVNLLSEIDSWLNNLHRHASGKDAPDYLKRISNQIDTSIFDFCRYGGNTFFKRIVSSLGNAEREISKREKDKPNPLPTLSSKWISGSDDKTPESILAISLASIYDPTRKIGPIRGNLEPIVTSYSPTWSNQDWSVAWNQDDLSTNLTSILERRLLDGNKKGCDQLPIVGAKSCPLNYINVFLIGGLDEQLLADLLWGFSCCHYGDLNIQFSQPNILISTPRSYAVLKLCFIPSQILEYNGQEINISYEPSIIPLLKAGRVGEACIQAVRRLRASGLIPMPHRRTSNLNSERIWEEVSSQSIDPIRLAASLLIPISSNDIQKLVKLVIRPEEQEEVENAA